MGKCRLKSPNKNEKFQWEKFVAQCFLTLGEPKITVLGIDGFVGPKIKIKFSTKKSVSWVGVKI